MELQTASAFGKQIDAPFREVEQNVRTELAKEGFGVLAEIIIPDKFKGKLGIVYSIQPPPSTFSPS